MNSYPGALQQELLRSVLRAYVAPLPPGCPGPPRSEGLYVPLMKVRVHAAEEEKTGGEGRGDEGRDMIK